MVVGSTGTEWLVRVSGLLFASFFMCSPSVLGYNVHALRENMSIHLNDDMMPGIPGGMDKPRADGQPTCLQFVKDMVIATLPAFDMCMREMGLHLTNFSKAKEVREFLPCFGKCMGMQLHVINPDGTPNLKNARRLMNDLIPKRFVEFVWVVWDNCERDVLQMGAHGGEDPNCESYRPGIRCVTKNTMAMASDILRLCPDVPDAVKDFAQHYLKDKRTVKYFDTILY